MSDSIDDLPEIQLEEVIGEEETPPAEQAAATLPEIDIDLDLGDGGLGVDEDLLARSDSSAGDGAAETKPAPKVAASGLRVEGGGGLQLSGEMAPEAGFEPQFELDPSVASIPTASGQTPAAAGPLPELELDVTEEEAVDIGLTELAARPAIGGAVARAPADGMTPGDSEGDDLSIDIDTVDADAPQVLSSAFAENEPQQVGRQPAVGPLSDASLDLDAMLSDLENSSHGDGIAADPDGPHGDAPSGPEAEAMTAATGPEELVLDVATPGFEAEAATGNAPDFDEEAAGEPSPLEQSMANAARVAQTPDESDAPPLPMSEGEPGPIPGINLEALKPDAETLATLQKLAGPAAEPESMRAALHAAFKGEPYYAKALPEPRAFMIGIARVLVSTGYSVNEMVDAIMAALED